jgi:hypothetical protein
METTGSLGTIDQFRQLDKDGFPFFAQQWKFGKDLRLLAEAIGLR